MRERKSKMGTGAVRRKREAEGRKRDLRGSEKESCVGNGERDSDSSHLRRPLFIKVRTFR